ncbi:MAG TPA: hypothetical protein PKK18_10675 [Chitinophagales bacterium]|nr:hypothetical protein [Chitinophagales bacterium]HMW13338.1 hypothetical protein [Chitinophagales bacterium]HMY22423.1 hypothetical protein [Chitinophagales bacterium]HMZ33345.1 hypothetical protein [Chitinophagales bacterium]HNA37867.1 hypothetical protein [Chitinophagales bacterium]
MNTRLVLWGEIGTDRKALIAIQLDEETSKIHTYAFPKEMVTKEIQDALFVEWKNGGEYTFPEGAIQWEIDANSDSILPEEVKVERLDVVLQSQHKWSKKLMSSKINQLLEDEVKLLEEKASVVAEYDQTLWDKAKTQWEKIASYQKKNEISWEQTTALKDKINAVFDALKAVKRINHENEDQANNVLVKNYKKRLEDLQAKLIYNDQWKHIADELKKIQAELKDTAIKWNHKRAIYNQINDIFDNLKKYRMTEVISKTQGRISQLNKILHGLKDSIARDMESYNQQVEKMQHYTRGKLSADELKNRFGYLLDKTKEKEEKAAGILQTITQLKNDIEKEKKQEQERAEKLLKRQQEEEQKAQNKAEETAINQAEIQAPISETTANEINHDDKEEIVAVSSAVEAETPTNTSELAS